VPQNLKRGDPQNRNLQKTRSNNQQISIKQAQNQGTRKSSRKPRNPKFAGKPQGWQHWCLGKTRLFQPHFFQWMRGSRVKLKSLKKA